MDEEFNMDDIVDYGSVTLTLEDDTEVECIILAIFPADGKDYIALLPVDENGEAEDDAEVLIYRFIDHGEDAEPELMNIEDDEEYEIAADAFDEMLDDEEFDEEDEDEEDDED